MYICQICIYDIYIAKHENGATCVIKRASARLHNKGVGRVGNKLYKVCENIVNEAGIMKYLTSQNPPKGMAKYIDSYGDGINYFLLMDNAGKSLCDHVVQFHKKINQGKLKLNVWQEHIQILFKQMCKYINWLHNTAKMVHLDISLENSFVHIYV